MTSRRRDRCVLPSPQAQQHAHRTVVVKKARLSRHPGPRGGARPGFCSQEIGITSTRTHTQKRARTIEGNKGCTRRLRSPRRQRTPFNHPSALASHREVAPVVKCLCSRELRYDKSFATLALQLETKDWCV